MSILSDRRFIFAFSLAILFLLGCTCTLPIVGPTEVPAATATSHVIVVTATPSVSAKATKSVPSFGTQEQMVIDIYQRVAPAVVYVEVIDQDSEEGGGSGSGFVFDKEGHIITNAHVVRGAELIRVYFSDDTIAEATILGLDDDSDLAVLQVDVSPEILFPVQVISSADLQVGQVAIAIGNPFGYERTLTVGYVSALGRVLKQESAFSVAQVIQTDAAINPGNSGGPLLNLDGQVIGVNSYYRPANPLGGGSIGIGFAIPSDLVNLVVPDLIASGNYHHPWLGISGYPLTPDIVQALDLSVDQGALIASVIEDGPSANAGLLGGTQTLELSGYPEPIPVGGDIIIAIDGAAVHGMDDIITYLQGTRIGQQVMLTIVRDGQEMAIPVVLGERPVR